MKTPLSRISEIILSLGIPAVAYISSSGPLKVELILPTVVLIMLGAWHVVTVNDDSFAVHTSFFDLFLEKKHRCAKLLAPSAIVITVPFMPLQAAAVLATILLWDLYSLYGKRNWRKSLALNFLGGASHYLIGVACVTASFAAFAETAAAKAPEALFFALAMTSGSMHQDSFDIDEDRLNGYITGAVRFSPDFWWRLGCVPLILATIPLFLTDTTFRSCFLGATAAYIAFYALFSISSHPSGKPRFRIICRIVFILAAAIFAALSI